ncbi:putative 6-phosphogluconate dehydrogenase [Phialemonium atrogriseum]|uniref:6-phosphogluconate dehydrogenase n=1 Tax=Phialemonium atrogriseum TaxID=1093897 RepID=A0AAJ0BRY8_9PEZI|nr:putative 6-phosphogluconate dehydrogenase [Phialemonium atrogriseum]KAK1761932.1 putative 6-phosphogluconate dehydrogenase [Phialemonium atrogriseum]
MATTNRHTPLATIGILSIGDMGLGIAKLLKAKGFSVATNCQGRSQDTIDRAAEAHVNMLPSDVALVGACDVILSVVPPRDAEATAQRILDAVAVLPGARDPDAPPLHFADMNAVAPSTSRAMAASFAKSGLPVAFVDGSIIGGPPTPLQGESGEWSLPLMPASGPHKLADLPRYGEQLTAALRMRHISDEVGAASGLKMCFASMTKGYTAIALQAFTSARRMGVLGDLQDAMRTVAGPARLEQTEAGLVGMAPKAYRWVCEMEEIGKTHAEEGGFDGDLFRGVAGVYRTVADDTVLGLEKVGKRVRGTTADDIAQAMVEGMEAKRRKTE